VKKIMAGAALVAAAGLVFSSCAKPPDETASGSASGSASAFKACMVSDQGGFDDKSFNQSGYEGLQKAGSELGVQVKTAESKDAKDFSPNLAAMKDEKCGLTVTVGYMLAEATKAAAEASPDSHFAIVDDSSITADNVKPLVFKTSDAAFLAGYVAAGYSKSGIVATFGGVNIPTVSIFMDGFVDGVAQYNADNGKSVKVLGWDKDKQDGSFSGDFDDQTKGKNVTKGFIEQGADVVMPVAGPVGLGAAAAAKEAGDVAIVWVDSDGYETSPEYKDLFLTSVMKEIGQAVYDTVKDAAAGNYSADPYIGTLANGGVGIAPYHDFDSKIDSALKSQVEQLQTKIASGELKVTSPSDPK
jgi:basic membrane protein A